MSCHLTSLHELRDVGRDARADDDELLLFKSALAVVAGFDPDSVVQQDRNLMVEFFFRFGVGNGNAGALVSQKESAGNA